MPVSPLLVIAIDFTAFAPLVIASDVASACGAGKSEQKEAPRQSVPPHPLSLRGASAPWQSVLFQGDYGFFRATHSE